MGRDRRIKKTDRAIFEAILRLSEKTPPNSLTVTGIAREANITRKTFYDHFPSVTEAFDSLLESALDAIATKTDDDWKVIKQVDAPLDAMAETEIRLRLFLGNVGDLVQRWGGRSSRRAKVISSEEVYGRLIRPFAQHVKRGLIGHQAKTADSELLAAFVLAGTLWGYRAWLDGDIEDDIIGMQSRVCDLIMNGLRGTKQL